MNLSRRQLLSRAGLALGAGVVGVSAKEPEGTLWSVYDFGQERPRFQFRSRKGPVIRDGFAEFDDCAGGLLLNCRFNLKDYTIGTNLKIVSRHFFPETDPAIWKECGFASGEYSTIPRFQKA